MTDMKDRIREVMESLHKSQQEFAQHIEMAPATVSSVFNGRTKPSLAIVEAIKKKIPNISVEWLMFGTGHMYDTPTRQHDQNVQNVSGSGELMMDFGFNDEDTTSTNDNNADSTGKNINSVKHTRLDNVHNEVKHIDIAKRKVIEIRVYYDDQTFETFVPAKH